MFLRKAAQHSRNPQRPDRVWLRVRVKIALRERLVSASLSLQLPLSPDCINCRIHKQFEDEGGADATNHRSGDSLHYFGTRAVRPKNRYQSNAHSGEGHKLRSESFRCAFHNRIVEVAFCEWELLTFR